MAKGGLSYWGGDGLTMMGAYGTMPMMINLWVHSLFPFDPGVRLVLTIVTFQCDPPLSGATRFSPDLLVSTVWLCLLLLRPEFLLSSKRDQGFHWQGHWG